MLSVHAEGEALSVKEMKPSLEFLDRKYHRALIARTGIMFFKSSGILACTSSCSGAPRP